MAPKAKAKTSVSTEPFAIGMRTGFIEAPPFRPGLNLGCCMDIPTGRFERGYDGHWYHTGGLNQITGIGGRGNTFKSALAHAMMLIALGRFFPYVEAQARDTEFSQTYARFQELAVHLERLVGVDLSEIVNFMITSQGEDSGNVWFGKLVDHFQAKRTAGKKFIYTTPFMDNHQHPLTTLYPSIVELDSMSGFLADVAAKILEENEVGESGGNTVFLRNAGAKAQMMMQLPGLMATSGGYFITTAHMDEEIKMEAYAPDTRKLAYMKMNLKFKNVPNNFHTLTNNLWMVLKAAPEQDDKKRAKYPRDVKDNGEGNTDLMCLTVVNLRGKQGPSGLPFDLYLSQSEGLLVPVTEFEYLKSRGFYGVTKAGQSLTLDLYPGVEFDRLTLRSIAYGDVAFQRAMTITSELCQIKYMKPEHHAILVTPKKLLEGLIAKGFDMEKILHARGYWVFCEHESEHVPFLSTMDLLQMNAGDEEQRWYQHFKKS